MPYIRNVTLSLCARTPLRATTLCFCAAAMALALAVRLSLYPFEALATPAPEPFSLCDTSREALIEASAIRGLQVLHKVPCVVQDKPLVEAFLHETINTELPPHKIQMEELTFRTVGLIPDDFDYGKRVVEFLVSQIGGYYDPKKKHFIMAAWLPASIQYGVAVHELTHALQDQHFGLRKLLDPQTGSTDSDIAKSALIEGDASAVMFDEQSRKGAKRKLQDLPSVDSLLLIQVLGLNFGAAGGEVPDALKGLLIFPYTSGLRFVHALLRNGGYSAVDKAYSKPPTTSRQILHPEEFIKASFTASIPQVNELPGYSKEREPEYQDTLGEFAISAILSAKLGTKSEASTAARGWVGDRLAIFPEQNGERLISWLTRWESALDAQEFYVAYTKMLEARYSVKIHNAATGPIQLSSQKAVQISRSSGSVSFEFTVR